MKKNLYSLLSLALIASITAQVTAQTWRPHKPGLSSGFSAKTVYGEGTAMIVTNSSFGGTQVYYTPDSGTAFTASASTLGMFSMMESQVVKSHGVLFVSSAGGIFKSHDMGHTWATTPETQIAYAMYAHNDTMYASLGAGLGTPNISTDSGNTWATIGYSGSLSTCFLKYNGVLYVGSTNGIQYTADGGAHWSSVTAPGALVGQTIVGITALNGNVYAACSNGVFKSTDNGGTWNNVLAVSMFCLTTIDTSLLGGTATSGIYQSNQNGTSWNQINSGLSYTGVASYNTIGYITYNDNYVIAMGGDSTIYVTAPATLGLHPASSSTGVKQTTQHELSCTIMPNPAVNAVTVQMANAQPGSVTVSLYDLTGHQVKNLAYYSSAIHVDLQDIPAGTYVMHVDQGDMHTAKKLVVTK